MAQSLSKVYIHIVFSTKHHHPLISPDIRKALQAYTTGIIAKMGSYAEEIYANQDHVHILITLPRTMTIADIVSKIKTSSSKWLKTKGINNFGWQDGYGVFSVSASKLRVVGEYIQNQAKHHEKVSLKDELRVFFREYDIEFDERYVWD